MVNYSLYRKGVLMIEFMSSPELKASAKARLAPPPISGITAGATAIVYGLILFTNLSASVPTINSSASIAMTVFASFLSWIASIVAGTLHAGYQYLFLRLYCSRPISPGNVCYCFQTKTKAPILAAIIGAVQTLALLPSNLFAARFIATEDYTDASLAFFFLTFYLVISTMVDIVYSQIYYLMLDFPDYSVRELFYRSRMIMRGHKGRLFYIIVSFIPWYLAGICTCFIGFLWIMPYVQAVKTEFYLDIVSKKA